MGFNSEKMALMAKDNLETAIYLNEKHSKKSYEIICNQCQQAGEKYLKAFLLMRGVEPDLTHKMTLLRRDCMLIDNSFEVISRDCAVLDVYGVIPRYPNDLNLMQAHADKAITSAKNIESFTLGKMGLNELIEDVQEVEEEKKIFLFQQIQSGLPLNQIRKFSGLSRSQFDKIVQEYDAQEQL